MGRKINVSQPVVVNTELTPLDIVFNLTNSATLEQWYYDNSQQWSPDRTITPLILTPSATGVDTETNTRYTLTFYTVQWFANEYRTNGYVESQITNTTDGNVDYVIVGNTLKVKKNVTYDHAVQIKCRATYIDPRDAGRTGVTERIVTLNCSKDAQEEIPTLDVLCESSMTYNPLTRDSSIFSLTGTAYHGASEISSQVYYVWYIIQNGNEILAQNHPAYVSGQYTRTLRVDALYDEDLRIILRAKASSSAANFYPAKVYRSIAWRIPDIDSNVISYNGEAYRSSIKKMTFATIINTKGKQLTDAKKDEHMKFNWKTRQSRSSTEIDRGWGLTCILDNSALQSSNGSVLVYPDIYILGAYEPVTHNGVAVTHNGGQVYHRFV